MKKIIAILFLLSSCSSIPSNQSINTLIDSSSKASQTKKSSDTLNLNTELQKLEALITNKKFKQSIEKIKDLSKYQLSTHQTTRLFIKKIKLLIALNKIDTAIQLTKSLPAGQSYSLDKQKANLFFSLDQPTLALKTYLQSQKFSFNYSESNRQELANHLFNLTSITSTLSKKIVFKNSSLNSQLTSWIELHKIAQELVITPTDKKRIYQQWHQHWSQHIPNYIEPSYIQKTLKNTYIYPQNIAFFLPFSGNLSHASEIIRDSFITILLKKNITPFPTLHFFDTNEHTFQKLYQSAISKNIDYIIGPLKKENIPAFLKLHQNNTIPAIVLNTHANSNTLNHPNITFYALQFQDEINQMIKTIKQNSINNLLLIKQNTSWSQRYANTFEKQWKKEKGSILYATTFNNTKEINQIISNILLIPNSIRRKNNLEQKLKHPLTFTPKPRQDIEGIVYFTDVEYALITDLALKYHHIVAKSFSTSHINTKKVKIIDTVKKITYCDIPWRIQPSNNKALLAPYFQTLNNQQNDEITFYGLGNDLFYLLKLMPFLKQYPYISYKGATGNLTLSRNQIMRTLTCKTL